MTAGRASGPLILGAIALLGGLLVYFVVRDPEQAQIQRGVAETDVAFAHVQQLLRDAEPAYRWLIDHGVALQLRQERDGIVTTLARLRTQRVDLEHDPTLHPRERLPAMQQLADDADVLAARVLGLKAEVESRREFIEVSSPLLGEARALRDRLIDIAPDEASQANRARELATSFVDLENQARTTDQILKQNVTQGVAMGEATLGSLRKLIEEQKKLLAELGG